MTKTTASALAIAASLVAASGAWAQAAPDAPPQSDTPPTVPQSGPIQSGAAGESPEIVVTGSFIRGTPEDAALPVDVISADEIARQGSPTLVELVKALPSSTNVVGDSNQFGAGQTTGSGNVNLRGLGATRTLVLLNGRRLTPSPGGTSVDTNLLPSIAVGRIEVLKDGAAALYGSDAIAGVVNFITRTDLRGVEAVANYSFIDGSDGDYNLGVNVGFKLGDRGNVLLSGAYRARSELSTRKRDWALRNFFTNPQGGWSQFGNPGTYVARGAPVAGIFVDPACEAIAGPRALTTTNVPFCGFNYSAFDNLVEDEKHFQFFGQANYEVVDNVELHLEGLYSGHNVARENSSPSYSPVQFLPAGLAIAPGANTVPGAFLIPSANPGLQALFTGYTPAQFQFLNSANLQPLNALQAATLAAQARLGGGVQTTILSRPIGVGGNILTGFEGKEDKREFNGYRFSGGLKWDISPSSSLDVAATYMENYSDVRTPDIVVSRYQRALAGLGGFGCTTNTPGANGCLYFNPFSSGVPQSAIDGRVNPGYVAATANSREVVDYLFEDYAYKVRTRLFVADAVFSGQLPLDIGGGPIGFAVGGQYRKDFVRRDVADLANVDLFPCVETELNGNRNCPGRVNGVFSFFGPLNNYDFNRDVGAVFAEIQVPFTDRISFQGAVRYENFGAGIGGTTNPKGALRWQVTDWLALRGSASTTFRAPPQVQTVPFSTTALAFTSAVGGYRAYDTFGNPALTPETANTYNAGIILQHGGFNATIDYYRFDFDGPIDNEPGTDTVAALFPTGVTDAAACAAAQANAAFYGRFTFLNNQCSRTNLLRTRLNNVNSPNVKTDGIDYSVTARADVGGGRLSAGSDGSYVLNYKADDFFVEGVLVTPADNYAGKLDYLGYGSIPRFKGQAYAQFDLAEHTLRYTFRYVSGMRDTRGATTFTAASPLGRRIRGYPQIDLNYTLNIEEMGSTLTLSVTNLTNQDPPFARLDLNYDPFTGNPLGRVYKVGIRQKF